MKPETNFLNDLNASRRAVNEFASMLKQQGISVWMPPERTRPDQSQRRRFSDDGDLRLFIRVEHKTRPGLSFTCRRDFPFQTVFVDEVYNFHQKSGEGPPLAYVIVNAAGTHAAVIYYAITRRHWKKSSRWDESQKRRCDFYEVDKDRVRFCPVAEFLASPVDMQL